MRDTMNKNGAESANVTVNLTSRSFERKLRYVYILEAKERLQKLNWGGSSKWEDLLEFLRRVVGKEVNNPIAQALLVVLQAGVFIQNGRDGFGLPPTRDCFNESLWQNARDFLAREDSCLPVNSLKGEYGDEEWIVAILGSSSPENEWEEEFVEETRRILFS